jgi:hypothetical protein
MVYPVSRLAAAGFSGSVGGIPLQRLLQVSEEVRNAKCIV